MADISNLKGNEHSNVERLNLRESLQWKMKIENITSDSEYRMDEQFQNLLSSEILIVFQIEKIL